MFFQNKLHFQYRYPKKIAASSTSPSISSDTGVHLLVSLDLPTIMYTCLFLSICHVDQLIQSTYLFAYNMFNRLWNCAREDGSLYCQLHGVALVIVTTRRDSLFR